MRMQGLRRVGGAGYARLWPFTFCVVLLVMLTPDIVEQRLDVLRRKRQEYEKLVMETATGRQRPVDYEAAMLAAIAYGSAADAVIAVMYDAIFKEGKIKAVQ